MIGREFALVPLCPTKKSENNGSPVRSYIKPLSKMFRLYEILVLEDLSGKKDMILLGLNGPCFVVQGSSFGKISFFHLFCLLEIRTF